MGQSKELQLKEHSTGLIATLTNPEKARDLERGLTINKIVEHALPICDVQKAVGVREVAMTLDIHLTKLVSNFNLKWNLSDAQIKSIVEDLLDKYKNESLEDFILVFKKARQNEFGEVYRLDSAVIFGWMDKYLEEKYMAVESKLMAEKDDYNKQHSFDQSKIDWPAKWLSEVLAVPGKPVLDLSQEEIKKEGQERPIKKVYPFASKSMLDAHDLHNQWIRENFDAITGKPKEGWISEEQFLTDKT